MTKLNATYRPRQMDKKNNPKKYKFLNKKKGRGKYFKKTQREHSLAITGINVLQVTLKKSIRFTTIILLYYYYYIS